MGINLQKGQRISLEKESSGLTKVMMGLGWDVNANPSKAGFLGKLLGGGGGSNFDLDASCLLLDENKKLQSIVYYGNLRSPDGSITHTGDNLTGEGDGDDEQIIVEFPKVANNIHRIVFVVNIYQAKKRQQHFGMVQNAYVRVLDARGNKEIAKYTLTDDYNNMTSMIIAELYRHNNEWKMAALGDGSTADSLNDLAKQYK